MKKLYLENFEYSNFVYFNNGFYIEKEIEGNRSEVLKKISSTKSMYLKDLKEINYKNDKTTYLEEYISGETLSEKNVIGLSFEEIKIILKDLLLAMKDLHSVGVIHRDIKPENIIITKTNNAILIDYNITRIFDDNKNKDTTLYGTEYYASPEQYGSLQTSFSSDIYSFGKTIKEVFGNNKNYNKIEKIIDKCLEFDPNNRYKDVDEILSILDSKINSNKKFKIAAIFLLFISLLSQLETSILYAKESNLNGTIILLSLIGDFLIVIVSIYLLFKIKIFNKEMNFFKGLINIFIFLFIVATMYVFFDEVISFLLLLI